MVYASCPSGLAAKFLFRKPNRLVKWVRQAVFAWTQPEETAPQPHAPPLCQNPDAPVKDRVHRFILGCQGEANFKHARLECGLR